MKTILTTLAIVIANSLMVHSLSFAAVIEYPDLSLSQAFAFTGDTQIQIGHMVSLQIGTITIPADITVINPLTKQNYRIVGPLTAFKWSTIEKDPMNFTFSVSEGNRQKLKALLPSQLTGAKITFSYQVFTYDKATKAFYVSVKSFHMKQKGILRKIGKDMPSMKALVFPIEGTFPAAGNNTSVSINPSPNLLKTPVSYSAQMAISPGREKQDIYHAVAPRDAEILYWGK